MTYLLIIIIALLFWLISGIYIIQPGEEGVVQTFGRFSAITTPGLNYHWPWPLQRVTKVDVETIRRAEIGFRTSPPDLKQQILNEALMLTEDENIVQVELLVQYRVANPRAFVFNVKDPETVLRTSTEVALRSTVGQMTIDAVITEERARVQSQTREFLTRLMDQYQNGILITDVRLQVADPPEEVRDAFQEVVRARADRERLINESEAYQNNVVPRARGEKQRLIEEATGFKEKEILRAAGEAERFLTVLEAYRLAPDIARERMHDEVLEEILNQVNLTLIDGEAVGQQILPFLPLGELNSESPPVEVPDTQPPAESEETEEGGN
jgi:membrane protease subunit HflK